MKIQFEAHNKLFYNIKQQKRAKKPGFYSEKQLQNLLNYGILQELKYADRKTDDEEMLC